MEKALNRTIGGVRGVYNRAEYAPQRREMLQFWADYIEQLLNNGCVIMGRFKQRPLYQRHQGVRMAGTRDREVRESEEEQEQQEAREASLTLWRLCDELTVVQAALLVAGCDPGSDHCYVEGWDPHKRPAGYEAAKAAITNSLRRGTIKGQVIGSILYSEDGDWAVDSSGDTLNVSESSVEVQSLKAWLMSRGVTTGFFFPAATYAPDYLDPVHPRYAPKLAAAVRAWLAVDDPKGKHPKQALMKWLREHAADFGLSDDDGKPNEQGIEECAKVANWQPGGGAPKTPGT